jgi:hypothetical protein
MPCASARTWTPGGTLPSDPVPAAESPCTDSVDIATLLRAGHSIPDIIGYATTIFDPLFDFPAATFLRALVYFEAGTAPDVPDDMKRDLEAAVVLAAHEAIPTVEPFQASIRP